MMLKIVLIFTVVFVRFNSAEEGNVLVQFDFVEPPSWSQVVRHTFRKILADYANQYCLVNFSACSMDTHRNFSFEDVRIESGYPQLYHIGSILSFHVQLPQSGANLPPHVLEEIVKARRIEIQTSLKSVLQKSHLLAFQISHVNSVLVLPPYDETLNKVMIPIALIVLLSLALFIAACEINRSLIKKAEFKEIQKRLLKEKAAKAEEKNDNTDIFQATSDNREISV